MNAISKPKPAWEGFPPLPRLPDLRPEIRPYCFQDYTIARAGAEPKFGVGAATGLGKTFQAYEVVKRFRGGDAKVRAIFLTNKSATLQFGSEHAKFYTSAPRQVAIHDKMPKLGEKKYADSRRRAYAMLGAVEGEQLDFIVMNYAVFRIDFEPWIEQAVQALRAAGGKLVLVTDEATAYQNRATETHRMVNALSQMAAKTVILTATLTKGKLEQIYGIFAGVGLEHVIAPTWEAFLERYCICAASRTATIPKAKLEEVYYFIVHNKLDADRPIYGLKPFYRRFAIKIRNGMGRMNKSDLDDIRALCARSPMFAQQVPDLPGFYRHLGVQFEEAKAKAEPIITGYRSAGEFIASIAPYVVLLTKADAGAFLPPFVPKIVPLEHTPEQRRLIHDIYQGEIRPGEFAGEDLTMDADGYAEVARGSIPVERLVEQGHIRRALLDPRLVHRQRLDDLSPKAYAPKTEELLRFLRDEATGEKIIVYTPSKQHLKLLAETIREVDGLDACYADPLEIHGDVSAGQRETSRQLFQESPEHSLILLNDAGLESLNLQAASILIVLGMPRSGGDMIQLAGRLSRLGSKHQSLLLLYYLVEDSQDFDDYLVIQRQMQLVALIMGEAERGLIDHASLREFDGVGDDIDPERYRQASLSRLVVARRPRRMRSYGIAA